LTPVPISQCKKRERERERERERSVITLFFWYHSDKLKIGCLCQQLSHGSLWPSEVIIIEGLLLADIEGEVTTICIDKLIFNGII
jgi:hypothetical protein